MRTLCKWVILCCTFFILSGCWDRYELEERAIVLGIAVDRVNKYDIGDLPEVTYRSGHFPKDKGDYLYKVTAQVAVPGKIKLGPEGSGGEGSGKTAWILETYGHTMKDAMASLQQQLAEKLYLGHLQIVVVSDKIAQDGITEVNDFLKRDHEVRRTAWMVVNKSNAAKVLMVSPPLETVPSLYLSSTLDNAVRFGKLPQEYLGEFWVDLSDMGVDAILPAVKVINNDRIMVDGLACFRGEKMVERTTPIEIGSYMSLAEKNPGGYSLAVSLDDNNGVYLVKTLERKSRLKIDLKNGEPTATFNIKIEAKVDEETGTQHLNRETLKKLEHAASKKAERLDEAFIGKLQKKGSDIFGIGARIRAKYGTYWDQNVRTNKKWRQIFKRIPIKTHVNYQILRTGMKSN